MFVGCKFDRQAVTEYTYRYDGPCKPQPGEYALMDVKGKEKMVYISTVDVPEPSFECKPIFAILVEKAPE